MKHFYFFLNDTNSWNLLEPLDRVGQENKTNKKVDKLKNETKENNKKNPQRYCIDLQLKPTRKPMLFTGDASKGVYENKVINLSTSITIKKYLRRGKRGNREYFD